MAKDPDVFICHTSEDKETFVRLLAEQLKKVLLNVWYDDFSMQLGDSVRNTIEHGLKRSRFGL